MRSRDRGFVCRILAGGRDPHPRDDGPGVPEGWAAGDQPGPGSVSAQRRRGRVMRGDVAGGDSQRSLHVSDGGCGV